MYGRRVVVALLHPIFHDHPKCAEDSCGIHGFLEKAMKDSGRGLALGMLCGCWTNLWRFNLEKWWPTY